MTSLEFLREACLAFLKAEDIPALLAFPNGARRRYETPFVLVSVKELSTQGAGFQNYLGERYDEATKRLEERYGLKTEVCFSLDVYSPTGHGEAGVRGLIDRLAGIFANGAPAGLGLQTLSWGQCEYDESCDMLRAEGEARLAGLLYAVQEDDGSLISFEVRGGMTLE